MQELIHRLLDFGFQGVLIWQGAGDWRAEGHNPTSFIQGRGKTPLDALASLIANLEAATGVDMPFGQGVKHG
jgi:ADP-heptose:LPS heptosyltransferase